MEALISLTSERRFAVSCDLLLKATPGITIAVVSSRQRKRRHLGPATDDPAFVVWDQLIRCIQGHPSSLRFRLRCVGKRTSRSVGRKTVSKSMMPSVPTSRNPKEVFTPVIGSLDHSLKGAVAKRLIDRHPHILTLANQRKVKRTMIAIVAYTQKPHVTAVFNKLHFRLGRSNARPREGLDFSGARSLEQTSHVRVRPLTERNTRRSS
jgi:hypothetical protein